MRKGYVQVYTGNGKGKTTAALGLALRSLCAGSRVFFGQFMKGWECSELKACDYFRNLEMEQFGSSSFVHGEPSPADVENAKKGLKRMADVLSSGSYDLVVFDELNPVLFLNMLELEDVLNVLDLKPEGTEVIITGRYAPQAILDRADLVTEMQEVKHYYGSGIPAREGIEY